MNDDTIDGPRACTAAELPEAVALANSALRQGSDQSLGTDYPLVFRDRNLENIRILKVNGEIAAEVPFIPWSVKTEDGSFTFGHISPTATAVQHRKKGYGLQCLQDCIKRMDHLRLDLSVLWTAVATFPFYENGDYQAVQKQGWIYLCGKEDAKAFPDHGEKIVPFDPTSKGQLDAVQAMHERDKAGVHRTAEAYLAFLSLPKMKTLIASRAGQPVAYAVYSWATKKPGLLEAGGDEAALETLVGRILSEHGADPIKAFAHLTPIALSRVLDRNLPGRRQMTPQNQMMRINNPYAFFGKISGWLERKNQGRERLVSISVADETIGFHFSKNGLRLGTQKFPTHIVLSPRELVSVVFGPHPERPVEMPPALADLFPYYFPIEMLDHS